jgi:hypothetical protein
MKQNYINDMDTWVVCTSIRMYIVDLDDTWMALYNDP